MDPNHFLVIFSVLNLCQGIGVRLLNPESDPLLRTVLSQHSNLDPDRLRKDRSILLKDEPATNEKPLTTLGLSAAMPSAAIIRSNFPAANLPQTIQGFAASQQVKASSNGPLGLLAGINSGTQFSAENKAAIVSPQVTSWTNTKTITDQMSALMLPTMLNPAKNPVLAPTSTSTVEIQKRSLANPAWQAFWVKRANQGLHMDRSYPRTEVARQSSSSQGSSRLPAQLQRKQNVANPYYYNQYPFSGNAASAGGYNPASLNYNNPAYGNIVSSDADMDQTLQNSMGNYFSPDTLYPTSTAGFGFQSSNQKFDPSLLTPSSNQLNYSPNQRNSRPPVKLLPEGVCADLYEDCKEFAANGYCEKFTKLMKIQCRKSCKFCGTSDVAGSGSGDSEFSGSGQGSGDSPSEPDSRLLPGAVSADSAAATQENSRRSEISQEAKETQKEGPESKLDLRTITDSFAQYEEAAMDRRQPGEDQVSSADPSSRYPLEKRTNIHKNSREPEIITNTVLPEEHSKRFEIPHYLYVSELGLPKKDPVLPGDSVESVVSRFTDVGVVPTSQEFYAETGKLPSEASKATHSVSKKGRIEKPSDPFEYIRNMPSGYSMRPIEDPQARSSFPASHSYPIFLHKRVSMTPRMDMTGMQRSEVAQPVAASVSDSGSVLTSTSHQTSPVEMPSSFLQSPTSLVPSIGSTLSGPTNQPGAGWNPFMKPWLPGWMSATSRSSSTVGLPSSHIYAMKQALLAQKKAFLARPVYQGQSATMPTQVAMAAYRAAMAARLRAAATRPNQFAANFAQQFRQPSYSSLPGVLGSQPVQSSYRSNIMPIYSPSQAMSYQRANIPAYKYSNVPFPVAQPAVQQNPWVAPSVQGPAAAQMVVQAPSRTAAQPYSPAVNSNAASQPGVTAKSTLPDPNQQLESHVMDAFFGSPHHDQAQGSGAVISFNEGSGFTIK